MTVDTTRRTAFDSMCRLGQVEDVGCRRPKHSANGTEDVILIELDYPRRTAIEGSKAAEAAEKKL